MFPIQWYASQSGQHIERVHPDVLARFWQEGSERFVHHGVHGRVGNDSNEAKVTGRAGIGKVIPMLTPFFSYCKTLQSAVPQIVDDAVHSEKGDELTDSPSVISEKTSSTNSDSRSMQQQFPFKQCEKCGKRTSWVIIYHLRNGQYGFKWWRICPSCMTDDECKQMKQIVEEHKRTNTRSRLIIKR